ncbi:tetratricopeptide repeat protein [candidate division KSB1 bacterium]|nr:tetratricopeptide repeat protein [candidate division KSB1 bacterium]
MKKIKYSAFPSEKLQECINEETFLNYFGNNMTPRQREQLFKHLNDCAHCSAEYRAILKLSQVKPTAEELAELAQIPTVSPEMRFASLFPTSDPLDSPPLLSRIKNAILTFLENIFTQIKKIIDFTLSRGGVAFAGGIILIFAFFIGSHLYPRWRSNRWAESGQTLLIDSHKIGENNLRFSGGFEYDPFSNLRNTRQDKQITTMDSAFHVLNKAISLNPTNLKAQHLLGICYWIKKDPLVAKRQFNDILARDSSNAAIWNDLGVVAWYENNFSTAIQLFKLALKHQPEFQEALYNLNFAYHSLGQLTEAKEIEKRYLNVDSAGTWADWLRARD